MIHPNIELIETGDHKIRHIRVNGIKYDDQSYVIVNNLHDDSFSTSLRICSKSLYEALKNCSLSYLLNKFNEVTVIVEPISSNKMLNVSIEELGWPEVELVGSVSVIYHTDDWQNLWSPRQFRDMMSSLTSNISKKEISSFGDEYSFGDFYIDDDTAFNEGFGFNFTLNNSSETLDSLNEMFKNFCQKIYFEAEKKLNAKLNDNKIEKSIQFSPEYYQAGLGILNFFGTYLREQYPEEKATVKIEQNDLTVRMVIETTDGRKDIVEKALHEYELIVTGTEPFNKFSSDERLYLDLKSELRIAHTRLATQQDLIGFQKSQLGEQSKQIEQLFDVIKCGLSQPNNINIDFKPNITQTNEVVFNQNISAAIGNLSELISELSSTDGSSTRLNQLENSLSEIESENDPESVRHSPAMNKFKRLIDNIMDTNSDLHKTIRKAESGWEIAKDLAGKYNKIAEWCGLPTVPNAFIK